MNLYQFIASLTNSILSWPISIVVIVIILKAPLSRILNSINEFSTPNVKMGFENSLQKLSSSIETKQADDLIDEIRTKEKIQVNKKPLTKDQFRVKSESQINRKPLTEDQPQVNKKTLTKEELKEHIKEMNIRITKKRIRQIAEVSPPAAVLESWVMVEKELKKTLERLGIENNFTDSTRIIESINLLKNERLLSKSAEHKIKSLYRLKNKAAHTAVTDNIISYYAAMEYYDIAMFMVNYLKKI